MTDKTLTFAEGKRYKCRNGLIRKVIHIRPDGMLVVIDPNINTTATSTRYEDGKDYFKRESAWDLVEECKTSVVKKLYSNVIQGRDSHTKYGFFTSGFTDQPTPYKNCHLFEQRAIIEVTITDGVVTGASLYEDAS